MFAGGGATMSRNRRAHSSSASLLVEIGVLIVDALQCRQGWPIVSSATSLEMRNLLSCVRTLRRMSWTATARLGAELDRDEGIELQPCSW